MGQPWSPEQEVTAAQAQALIEAQFRALSPVHVELIGAGWDNTAFLVNQTYVFRFPRRQIAVDLLARENRLLPVLAPHLPLPIPIPCLAGQPNAGFPWPFAGYRLLPGRTACAAALDEEQRSKAAVPIAHFLSALHAFPRAEAEQMGAGGDAFDRLTLAKRIPKMRLVLEQIKQWGVLDDIEPFLALIDATPDTSRGEMPTLVHGDFYVRHLLVDADAQPAGVIDWGDVHVGQRSLDLAIAHEFLPPSAHDCFRRAYGDIDADTWRLARFRALDVSAILVAYGRETNDGPILREALRSLRNLVSAGM